MSLVRWAELSVACALVAGGCVPARTPTAPTPRTQAVAAAPQQAPEPRPGDFVVVRNTNGFAALDWAEGRVVYQTANAVPASDWSQLFVIRPSGAQSKLDLLDARTGVSRASVDVPDGLVVSAVSNNDRLVALSPGIARSAWQPAGHEQTRIVVAEVPGTDEPRVFTLDGSYEPDAFSADNRQLFVLEHLPAVTADTYRVRRLDLTTGVLGPVLSRSKELVPEETMRGTRQTHVLSPDRHTLYTLYTNQPEHLHSRDLAAGRVQASGEVYAFVHVLNLLEGWAYCLDLPQPMGVGPASAHALALSPDGRTLFVADRSTGRVAVADTNQLVVRTMADVAPDAMADFTSAPAAAAVGADGSLFLSGGSELLVIDPRSMGLARRLALPGEPTGLGLSADGRRLFVSIGDRVLAVDPQTGTGLGAMATAGAPRVAHVGQMPSR